MIWYSQTAILHDSVDNLLRDKALCMSRKTSLVDGNILVCTVVPLTAFRFEIRSSVSQYIYSTRYHMVSIHHIDTSNILQHFHTSPPPPSMRFQSFQNKFYSHTKGINLTDQRLQSQNALSYDSQEVTWLMDGWLFRLTGKIFQQLIYSI
jgi:hypothetical protein